MMKEGSSRRAFLQGLAALSAVALAPVAWVRRASAQKDQQSEEGPDDWVAVLGKIEDLNEKEPVLVKAQFKDVENRVVDEEKLFVRWERINKTTGRWIVLTAICTHLKCKVEFEEDHFACPCHGSKFDLEGKVLKRPAKKDLADYSDAAYEEDGFLKLKREAE